MTLLVLATSLITGAGRAADFHAERVTASDFGGIGLLQTRTARFAPDGTAQIGVSYIDPYLRVPLTLQALPWLESTFRYQSVRRVGGDLLDRGADLKFRLSAESRYWPALALGLQDIIGTGVNQGEYVVVSKRYLDFDFSLGLVWGHGAGTDGTFKNPFRLLSNHFKTRSGNFGRGGTLRAGNFFSGRRVGLTAGLEYFTPIEGLSFKVEYDPNDYKAEATNRKVNQDFPVNVGLVYRPYPWIETSLAFERGNRLMARLTLRTNFHDAGWTKFLDPPPPPLIPRPTAALTEIEPMAPALRPGGAIYAASHGEAPESGPSQTRPARRLFDGLAQQGLAVNDVSLHGNQAVIHVAAAEESPETVANAAQVALDALPRETESYTFVLEGAGTAPRRVTVSRQAAQRKRAVDTIFDGLEAEGFALLSIDLSPPRAVANLETAIARPPDDYRWAARLIAANLGMGIEEVIIVGWRGGVEDGRMVFRVGGATSGAGPRSRDDVLPGLIADLEGQGFKVSAYHLTARRITVFVTPTRYLSAAQNVGRAARVAANHGPAPVEEITVVTLNGGAELSRVTILRRDLEAAVAGSGSPEEILARAEIEPGGGRIPYDAVRNPRRYPDLSWSLTPQLRQSVGAPEAPYTYQIWARLGGRVEMVRGLSLSGAVGANLVDNFDKLSRGPKGTLPHVRSNIVRYLKEGRNNIVNLQADYIFSPAPGWYARLTGGLLEEMFAGVGGEVLYRPQASRWALGLEVNWVKQRDFDQLFSFRDYDVVTGHLAVHYKLPWYDLTATVLAGRYLAGDWGATFQLSRRFKSGIVVGAFFTRTNVSAREFGEGSFDKGFFVSVPFDAIIPKSTRERFGLEFRPLTSDGGQRLYINTRLYPLSEEGSLDYIVRDWTGVTK